MKRPTPIQFGLTAAEYGAEHGHDAFKLAAALGVRVRIILYCPDDLIYVPSGTSSRPTVIFLSPERPVGVRNRILAVGLAHHVRECSHDEVYCWRIVSGELRDELACWTVDRQWAQAFLGEPLPWGGGGAEGARGARGRDGRQQDDPRSRAGVVRTRERPQGDESAARASGTEDRVGTDSGPSRVAKVTGGGGRRARGE